MQIEIYPNESADRVSPPDSANGLNRDADASNNPFETNGEDSTDLSGTTFDDAKAQAIEATEGNITVNSHETAERLVDTDTYLKFTEKNLTDLFNKLDNPNINEKEQKSLIDQLLVTIELDGAVRVAQQGVADVDQTFRTLTNNYKESLVIANDVKQPASAEAINNHATAMSILKDDFVTFLSQNQA